MLHTHILGKKNLTDRFYLPLRKRQSRRCRFFYPFLPYSMPNRQSYSCPTAPYALPHTRNILLITITRYCPATASTISSFATTRGFNLGPITLHASMLTGEATTCIRAATKPGQAQKWSTGRVAASDGHDNAGNTSASQLYKTSSQVQASRYLTISLRHGEQEQEPGMYGAPHQPQ